MADVVLRDRNGAALQYPGVERVKFNTADGGQVEFVDPALIPEDAEAFIDTDETGFAAGDIEITPEEGAKFSKVTVKKPENLLPENIVAGVDIAGVVGTSGGETVTTVLLEPMTIGPFNKIGSAHPTTNEDLYSFQTDQAPVAIEKGKTYIVDWDGTQYTVVCKEFTHPELQGHYLYLGDGSASGFPDEHSNEPFCIVQMVSDTGSMVMFVTTTTNITHDFGLSLVTIQSGGGTSEEVTCCVYSCARHSTNVKASSAISSSTLNVKLAPMGAVFKYVGANHAVTTTYGSNYPALPAVTTLKSNVATVEERPDLGTIAVQHRIPYSVPTNYSYAYLGILVFVYTHPGFSIVQGQDGELTFYCDNTVRRLCEVTSWYKKDEVTVADLRDSAINAIEYFFTDCASLKTVYLPQTLTSIGNQAFYNCSSLEVVDLTNCTAVPTLQSNSFNGHGTNFEIRVPSALYDSFCAASNWSTEASYIVAV